MKFEKLLKIGAAFIFSLCLLFAAAVVGLFFLLPSASQVKNSFSGIQKSLNQSVHSNSVNNQLHEHQIPSSNSSSDEVSASDDSQKAVDSFRDIENFMNDGKPLSDACRTLRNITIVQSKNVKQEDFAERFYDSVVGKSSDPLMESFKPVLKYTLRQPYVKGFIEKIRQVAPDERDSVLSKSDFYYSAYKAYQEISANQKHMESILDHGYLTMMFGRLIELRPDLASDPQVLNYCEAIEKQLNEGGGADFDQDKKAFVDFLQEMNVDPKQIGFELDYQTKLRVDLNKNSLSFKGGWLEEAFARTEHAQASEK